jgi:hypothetical protein
MTGAPEKLLRLTALRTVVNGQRACTRKNISELFTLIKKNLKNKDCGHPYVLSYSGTKIDIFILKDKYFPGPGSGLG